MKEGILEDWQHWSNFREVQDGDTIDPIHVEAREEGVNGMILGRTSAEGQHGHNPQDIVAIKGEIGAHNGCVNYSQSSPMESE